MPTGYTAGILNGDIKTFKEFALQCMRQFGASIHMRDDSRDAPYEPRTPSEYYIDGIKEKEERIEEVLVMAGKEIIDYHNKRWVDEKKSYEKILTEHKENRVKLENMLVEANKWVSPTEEHMGIKKFMVDQITDTIKHDGETVYWEDKLKEIENTLLDTIDPVKEKENMLLQLEKDLLYYKTQYREDVKRCEESNMWVDELIGSL